MNLKIRKIIMPVLVVMILLSSAISIQARLILDDASSDGISGGSSADSAPRIDEAPQLPTFDAYDINTVDSAPTIDEAPSTPDFSVYNLESAYQSPQKYAVIMVGRYFGWLDLRPQNWGPPDWPNLAIIQQYYTWYLTDAALLHNTLRDTYGYPEENIIMLVKTLPDILIGDYFTTPDVFNPDGDWNVLDSDETILQDVLNSFKPDGERELTEDDSLFFCFIDHGATDSDDNTFFGCPFNTIPSFIRYLITLLGLGYGTDTQRLYDYELANYIDGIDAKMILALHPCNSGGFIDDISGENRVICTSTRVDEIDDGWFGPFRRALNEEEPSADLNGDGDISLLEAYLFAAQHVPVDQHPLIDDNGDGVGHHYLDSGFDPTIPGEDGYLASSTYL